MGGSVKKVFGGGGGSDTDLMWMQYWQQQAHNAELAKQKDLRAKQENVAKAETKIAEDAMFEKPVDEDGGLGIEGVDVDAEQVGGKRKRRKVQDTSAGLGI